MTKSVPKSGKSRRSVRHSRDAIWRQGIDTRMAEIERRLAGLESRIEGGWWRLQLSSPRTSDPARRQTRRTLDDHELQRRRDDLYDYCAYNWPELTRVISKAKSPQDLKQYLEFGFPVEDGYQAEAGKRLVGNSSALWAFTRSGRYHGDPLQVANGLAGVPELKWRTSLNRCSRIPPRIRPHFRFIRDHLRRRFPERFRELIWAKKTETIVEILSRTRSGDEVILMFRHIPDRVGEYLSAGLPRWYPI